MDHLLASKPKTTSTETIPKKTKKNRRAELIVEGQHENLEGALRDPKVAKQISNRLKYSEYLRNLKEIISVARNDFISYEEREYVLPIQDVLMDYSHSLFERCAGSEISDLKASHQTECANLNSRILELEAQVSNLQNLLTFGENAFLLEESCNAPQKKLMTRIKTQISIMESDVEASNGVRVCLGRFDGDDNYLKLLIAAIKDRFGPEGWELDVKKDSRNGLLSMGGLVIYLVPKKEVYLAMGVTEGSDLIARKMPLLLRFFDWLQNL